MYLKCEKAQRTCKPLKGIVNIGCEDGRHKLRLSGKPLSRSQTSSFQFQRTIAAVCSISHYGGKYCKLTPAGESMGTSLPEAVLAEGRMITDPLSCQCQSKPICVACLWWISPVRSDMGVYK
ncbi:hypothetical protein AMECASPLE_000573 [Ameca splendens]|uniref:Uncharacterized protein n=1 Tax=Ameca splendens TaxID=208324 RepID=A0ABV0XXM4_9TELE